MHHVVLDTWSRGRSPLHGADARLKVLAALGLLVAIALAPDPVALGCCAAAVLTGIAAARLPAAKVLLRASYVLPFAGTFALVTALAGDANRAVWLLGKSFLSALVALLLAGTTPLPALLHALEHLYVPRFLIDVIQYLYRYLFVVSEQAQHMRLAAACRGSFGGAGFRAAAGAVAVLFARSCSRAEAIHDAMLSRGAGAGDTTAAPPAGAAGAPIRRRALAVEARNLRYRYEDGTLALDGVDFELHTGEAVAVFGANGSGKTTFAHHLNGLLKGEGRVAVCGIEVERRNLAAVRRKIGIVFQDSDAQLFMPSVIEDVAFGPRNLGAGGEEAVKRACTALRLVGMEHAAARAPYHLSAGEKKRVALAGVLAMDPEVLVLDEPTTFLDPPAVRGLAALLGSLPQAKIIITHDALFARTLARRAVFFEHGKIAADGPVDDIIGRFAWDPRGE